jgi:hypothetical protein
MGLPIHSEPDCGFDMPCAKHVQGVHLHSPTLASGASVPHTAPVLLRGVQVSKPHTVTLWDSHLWESTFPEKLKPRKVKIAAGQKHKLYRL